MIAVSVPQCGTVGWFSFAAKVVKEYMPSVRSLFYIVAVVLVNFWCGSVWAEGNAAIGVSPEMWAFLARCAPTVHPETMAAVISAESRGHQFAIADAGPVNLPWSQRKTMVRSFYFGSALEAAGKANELIAAGHTVSLGPAQINDRNLASLGLSVESVFEPCANVAAGGRILTNFYQRASKEFGPGGRALRAALSAYNSGDWLRGEKEGYVDLVIRQVGRPLDLQSGARTAKNSGIVNAPRAVLWQKTIRNGERDGVFAMTTREFVATE